MTTNKPTDFSEYILLFPLEVQDILKEIRRLILETTPNATEIFSYGMPGFRYCQKPLLYFAAYKNHIGFYATPTGHEAFREAFAGYKQGKGSVQFPLNKPIPYDLIVQITTFRMQENEQKNNK